METQKNFGHQGEMETPGAIDTQGIIFNSAEAVLPVEGKAAHIASSESAINIILKTLGNEATLQQVLSNQK